MIKLNLRSESKQQFGWTKLLRVKATHGACGEHSMTHLARYPMTKLDVNRLMTLLPFSRTKSKEFEHLLLQCPSTMFHTDYRATPTLEDWTAVTAEEIQKLISSAPNTTCELDPAPTWLVKDMRGLLSPFIWLLFSTSWTAGCFPVAFKEALVRPLI